MSIWSEGTAQSGQQARREAPAGAESHFTTQI